MCPCLIFQDVLILLQIDDQLSQWRKKFGEHGLEALKEVTFNHLPINDTEHCEWWCTWALAGDNDSFQPFYYSKYEEPNSGDEGSQIQAKVCLLALASSHPSPLVFFV